MDPLLKRAVQEQMPPVNTRVIDGLAMHEMSGERVKDYVNRLFSSVQDSFPEGLVYESMQILTPFEEYYRTISAYGHHKYRYDIARSDMIMVLLIFQWQGQPIEKTLYLPFVRDGGMICIKGASFSISPILGDRGISYIPEGAFVQISKAKIVIKKIRHFIVSNGVRKIPNIAYSWLHRRDRKQDRHAVNCLTVLVHYLFAKYGVSETFRRFNGSEVVIGDITTLDEQTHPPDEWVICQSNEKPPRRFSGRPYVPSTLRIAIRQVDYDDVSEAMIGGLFYIADHFPERVLAHYLDGTANEIRLWRILLGLIIGGVTGGESCIKDAMDEHIEDSLDHYIDGFSRVLLEDADIYVNDIYELLYLIIENIPQIMLQSGDNIATLYNKQLSVMIHALRDINEAINKCLFALKNKAKKKEQGLTYADVSQILTRQLSLKAAMKMNNPGKHPEIASAHTPNDNKFFKITSNVVLQNDSGRKRNKQLNGDKTKFLHVSIAEVGSYIALTKSEQTGRGKLNPWVLLSDNGSILRNPQLRDITQATQQLISRR